ncbi:DUF707 domain-containing protein [Nocardia callitridis]|uniref:DUF707 domain-containing protein n=1 Tax=Nocardia callitridis TaxID=648753 RepID=UPI0031EA53B9
MRRNLVIIRADYTSQHERWIVGPGDRNWDLIVGYPGDDPGDFQSSHASFVHVEGPKWPALGRLAQNMADTIEQYDYIWIPNNDLMTDMASINTMFDICAEYELSLAQPALTEDSYVVHEITRVNRGQVLRYTNYVETMAPCFSGEFLSRCVPDLVATVTGLGLESLWPTMLGEDDIAVIDAATVRNIKHFPTRDYLAVQETEDDDTEDDYLTTVHKYEAREYQNFLAEKDIAPVEPEVRRSIPVDPDSDFPHATARESHRDVWWVASETRKKRDPSRCVVLVPVADNIEPDCARALFELEQLGYPVWRVFGASAIDQVRGQMATDALAAGFEELMWIDADISFPVDAVEQLRRFDLPIVCAVYTKKGQRELVAHLEPGTEKLTFGVGGGLTKIKYGATGFLLTKREVYEKIQADHQLPTCNKQFGRPMVPYFLPMAVPDGENHWYLGEDYAFCERARRSGFDIMADTTIRLGHIGRQSFGWEDAGSARHRYATFTFNF